MLGSILIKIGFFSALASSVMYYLAARKGNPHHLQIGRATYHGSVVALISAAAYLLYLILTHQFQYTYVWSYSSADLPLSLLISTMYAGQEGSFMLWALFTSIIGVFLMSYASRKDYEPYVMSVYSLIVSFLLLMIVVKNPFTYIWDAFPGELMGSGPIPAGMPNIVVLDEARQIWARYPVAGKGLNPLLQNYWMVIHPQVLFIGFSAMAVPFAMAIAALWKRDYTSWIQVATPWNVFGAMILGFGIILGGYWAYETLGWGGFWGWDPVENSSLVPWLISVAAIHTSLTQRKSGAFVRTNFLLSLLAFLTVLYSTFLTRSGILGETSVHSFVDPGMWVYWLLLIFMGVFTVLGGGLLIQRMREMPKVPVEHSILSRDFALFLGAASLTFVALFVLVGTSSPIITSLVKGKASAVDIQYYVRTNLPLGIAITLLTGLGQLLWWKSSRMSSFLRRLLWPAVGAVVITSIVLLMGWEDPLILLFVLTSSFALTANLLVGYEIYMGNPRYSGGAIAHIGLAIMCIGFVTSERYDDKKTVALEKGKTTEVMGYELTYDGYKPIEGGRFGFVVRVARDGDAREVAPVMYFSEFTNSVMRHPDLINYLDRDFYVAPLSLEDASDGSERKSLQVGKQTPVAAGNILLSFREFDFSDMQMGAMMEGKEFELKAHLDVRDGKRTVPLTLVMRQGAGGMEFPPVTYRTAEGKEYTFRLERVAPNSEDDSQSSVSVDVLIPAGDGAVGKDETLVIEASVKPFINLVWVGTITLMVGFVVTIIRRVTDTQRP